MKTYLEETERDETDVRFCSAVDATAKLISRFSDQVTSIKPLLRFLEKGTYTTKKERLFDTTQSCDDEVKNIFASTNELAGQVRNTLKVLQDILNSTADSGKKQVYGATTTVICHRFMGQLVRYHQVQIEYNQKSKERLLREAKIFLPDASEEELQQAVEMGQVQTLAYDKIMMNDPKHIEARTGLAVLQEQQQELSSLEASIIELNSVFLDVSTLMKSQEDLLLKIKDDLHPIRKQIRGAVNELRDAEHDTEVRRRRKILLWSTLTATALVGAAITIAPLFAFA